MHNTIKMKPVDDDSSSCADYNVYSDDKDPQFKIGDHVRMWKYKNILLKDMLLIGQRTFLELIKLKILFHGHML